MIKPFLKWVGGKTQIINELIEYFPKKINNYHEIFLGGGSVLFYILQNKNIEITGNIYAYDINSTLIYTYKNIQNNYQEVYNTLKELITTFKNCNGNEKNTKTNNYIEALKSKENFYYYTRIKYNSMTEEDKKSIMGSSLFIFLNKTCFRGLYRIGPNGFNVPYGHYKNPEIINLEHLKKIHELIKNVIFIDCDFKQSICNIKKDDFYYLDPPYYPENKKSFVNYTSNGFNLENHKLLFQLIKEKNNSFVMRHIL